MTAFYVASSLTRANEVSALIAAMTEHGWNVTYDWTTHPDLRGLSYKGGIEARRQCALQEITGITTADLFIQLLPCGRGSYVELGVALARNLPIIVHADSEVDLIAGYRHHCAFLDHPRVQILIGAVTQVVAFAETFRKRSSTALNLSRP